MIVARTADGQTLGPAFPHFSAYDPVAGYVSIAFLGAHPSFAQVSQTTGRITTNNIVYFSEPGCTGNAAIRSYGTVLNYAYEASGSSRIFVATSATASPFLFLSRYEPGQGAGCLETGGTVAVASEVLTAQEIETANYPFATPITLAVE